MANGQTAKVAGKLPLLLGAAGLAFGIPSAGLAVVSFTSPDPAIAENIRSVFTPASVDPQLARRVAEQMRERGYRFTPTNSVGAGERTVTVAVRVDSDTAKAISVRSAVVAAKTNSGTRTAITAIEPTRYNLGIARGYKSFARPITAAQNRGATGTSMRPGSRTISRSVSRAITLPDNVRKLDMPDLASFEPGQGSAPDKPSRFKPRLELEDNGKAGQAKGTLQGQGSQSVDVGGSYRVTKNLDVTAGVRITQENDRLAPIADSVKDNQAVYVGTQFRF